MEQDFRLSVRFWGVRGSTPTPHIENLNYGGNTPCVEVRLPNNQVLIMDGGTGIRALGTSLVEEFGNEKLKLHVFLTHFHWDHIQGIPFFPPLYHSDNLVVFHSMPFQDRRFRRGGSNSGLEETLKFQMADPYFPVSFDFLPARKEFVEVGLDPMDFGEMTIHPFPLNHPGKAFGYRIESEGAVVVYATDLEHGHKELDKVVRDFSQDADLLIYDAQYTPEDYPNHKGWGHSTWVEACLVAKDAKVKQLALFHHNPAYNDRIFFEVVQRARREFENTLGAREGLSVLI